MRRDLDKAQLKSMNRTKDSKVLPCVVQHVKKLMWTLKVSFYAHKQLLPLLWRASDRASYGSVTKYLRVPSYVLALHQTLLQIVLWIKNNRV